MAKYGNWWTGLQELRLFLKTKEQYGEIDSNLVTIIDSMLCDIEEKIYEVYADRAADEGGY